MQMQAWRKSNATCFAWIRSSVIITWTFFAMNRISFGEPTLGTNMILIILYEQVTRMD